MKSAKRASMIGRYIVTDPKICHGKPTFRGTRVLVADVLEEVARGMAWETIIEEWNDSITKDAIGEAVQLASQALLKHANEFVLELKSGVNILDENIPKPQRELLEARRLAVRQIGVNIGRKGLLDEAIIPLLLRLRHPTFFSRDSDFYRARSMS